MDIKSHLAHRRHGASAIKPWHLFLGIAVIFVLFFTNAGSWVGQQVNQNVPGSQLSDTTTPGAGLVSVTKPVDFNLQDPFQGSAMASATLNILEETSVGARQIESLTTASDGTIATGGSFKSGKVLWVEVSSSGDVNSFIKVTVPFMTKGDADSLIVNSVNIYGVQLGAWTFTVTGTDGCTFTDAGDYLIDQFTGSQVIITVSLSQDTNNEGYISSYDPQYKTNRYMIAELIRSGGNDLSIEGPPRHTAKGTTDYYAYILCDGVSGSPVGTGLEVKNGVNNHGTCDSNVVSGSLTKWTVGSNVYGGLASFSFTVKIGGLAAGDTEDIDIRLNAYADFDNFAETNDYGQDDAVQGSVFDLTFING